ncbi:maleate cis-trans isomerase family protein [Nakamurella sp. GG22]
MSHRIGLIVPSSNVTMETEVPELLGRRPERFTFHSARMRMTTVSAEALAAMDAGSDRCAVELADAQCDVLAYACLVAVMAAGPGAHLRSADRLRAASGGTPVVTSAGALIDGITALGARRVAMIAPYAPPLTAKVVDYLAHAGIEVVDAISLNVTDNRAVGRLDPQQLVTLTDRLDLTNADAVVLSTCVQMPSLAAIEAAEQRTGLSTLSAATATVRSLLAALDLEPSVPGGGALLSSGVPTHA